MKKTISITIILTFSFTIALCLSNNVIDYNNEWPPDGKKYKYIKNIDDAPYKNYAFSRIAQPGKITLFIISTHWCGPCYSLKEQIDEALINRIINPDEVDVYNYMVSRSTTDNIDALDKLPGYRQLKYIDKLTAKFPTTYIISPTTNGYAIVPGNDFDEIIKIVKELSIASKEYFDINNLFLGKQDNIGVKRKDIDLLKNIIYSQTDTIEFQKEYIKFQRDSLNFQRDSISTLKNVIDSLKLAQKVFIEKLMNEIKNQTEIK